MYLSVSVSFIHWSTGIYLNVCADIYVLYLHLKTYVHTCWDIMTFVKAKIPAKYLHQGIWMWDKDYKISFCSHHTHLTIGLIKTLCSNGISWWLLVNKICTWILKAYLNFTNLAVSVA